MDRKEEERKRTANEEITSSKSMILQLIADGKISEEDVELNDKEKELLESYKKMNKIIEENGIENLYWSSPID